LSGREGLETSFATFGLRVGYEGVANVVDSRSDGLVYDNIFLGYVLEYEGTAIKM
jgi:hypothetical protein